MVENLGRWSDGYERVRIWATKAKDADRNMIVNSWKARQPAVVAYADGPKGPLPLSNGVEQRAWPDWLEPTPSHTAG
jgi:hypothetical protein